jgi:large subunit ribosomal protein L14e
MASSSSFTRFVEVGRVAAINYGKEEGKLCVILDVVNSTRVLVDSADGSVPRQTMSLKRLALTDFKLNKVGRNARAKTLKAAWTADEIDSKWSSSAWGKRIAKRAATANLGDFGRFEARVAKKSLNSKIQAKLA